MLDGGKCAGGGLRSKKTRRRVHREIQFENLRSFEWSKNEKKNNKFITINQIGVARRWPVSIPTGPLHSVLRRLRLKVAFFYACTCGG